MALSFMQYSEYMEFGACARVSVEGYIPIFTLRGNLGIDSLLIKLTAVIVESVPII